MLEILYRIIALTRKELLAILKDPRGRTALLIPPIMQCLIFGYAATYDLNVVPYVWLDQDGGPAARELRARLDGTGVFRCVGELRTVADLKTAIDNRDALVALQVPPDFERQLALGQPTMVQAVADGRNSNTAGTALSYVATVVEQFNGEWLAEHPLVGAPQPIGTMAPAPAPVAPPRLTVNLRAWYNPNLETRWNMIPALIGTLTMLQVLLLTAMSVAREREQGTLDQLLVTPFRPFEIMVGKALPSILVGLVQATNILLVAQLWFRIPFSGSFVTLYVGLIFFLLAAIGLGLLLSSIALTMQQAMLYSFLVMMPFTLLSGLTTPISAMPLPLQWLTRINPLRYAIDIAQRVYLEGTTLPHLWPDLWPLMLIALVTLPLASYMFRHRLE